MNVEIPEVLLAIGERLRTQDNECTANPMFVVQQRKSVMVDPDGGDDDRWVYKDGYQFVDAETAKRLDDLDERDSYGELTEAEKEELEEHTQVGIYHHWEVCMTAFTREGCESYLRQNGHNLTEARIYVESFHRCPEMLALREFLMSLPAPSAPSDL